MKTNLYRWIAMILILTLAWSCALGESQKTQLVSDDSEPDAQVISDNPESEALPDMTLAEFQEKWGVKTEDFYAYYLALISERGPFELWSVKEQFTFDQMLEDIGNSRTLRDIYRHEGWIDNTAVGYEIGQWRYALPETVKVSQEEAVAKAGAMLLENTGLETASDEWQTGASLYSGHWYCDPFPTSWWVVHFYRNDVKVTDVWVSAENSDSPLHDTTTVIAQGKLPFLASGETLNGIVATEDMYTSDRITVFYLEESQSWMILVDSGRDSFWQIEINDQTLKFEDLQRSNG